MSQSLPDRRDLIVRDDIGPGVYDLPLGDGVTAEFSYDDDDGFRFWALRLADGVRIETDPNHSVTTTAQRWLEERLPSRV